MEAKAHHIGTLSPEMALLGQLYSVPSHGYDLHRKVVSELGQVWHLSQSQAYSILKRLEKKGDILVQEISQEKLPSRQLMHITDQGRQRFLSWLEAPSGGSTRAIRMEFVTRLYFLQIYMPDRLMQAFDRQKLEAKAQIERLITARAELSDEQVFNRMSVDLRLKQLDAVLDWLAEYQDIFK